MSYQIIPDKELNVDALMNSKDLLFTESEAKAYKKTPWTWHTLTAEPFEKNIDFYIDAGYSAFASVVTLDATLQNQLKGMSASTGKDIKDSKFTDIDFSALKIEGKANRIKMLSEILDYQGEKESELKEKSQGLMEKFYNLKMKGFRLSELCQAQIPFDEEKYNFRLPMPRQNRAVYYLLTRHAYNLSANLSLVKGSYVNYVESDRKSKIPGDIDLVISRDIPSAEEYYELTKFGLRPQMKVDGIEISLMLIPIEYQNGYTFFDLDVNEQSRFLYCNSAIVLRKNPEKIIRAAGAKDSGELRAIINDEDKIVHFCSQPFSHRKIYSTIRQPEIFYKKLQEINLEHITTEPRLRSKEFSAYVPGFPQNIPVKEIQRLLAESSIDLSNMFLKLNDYLSNKK